MLERARRTVRLAPRAVHIFKAYHIPRRCLRRLPAASCSSEPHFQWRGAAGFELSAASQEKSTRNRLLRRHLPRVSTAGRVARSVEIVLAWQLDSVAEWPDSPPCHGYPPVHSKHRPLHGFYRRERSWASWCFHSRRGAELSGCMQGGVPPVRAQRGGRPVRGGGRLRRAFISTRTSDGGTHACID